MARGVICVFRKLLYVARNTIKNRLNLRQSAIERAEVANQARLLWFFLFRAIPRPTNLRIEPSCYRVDTISRFLRVLDLICQ